MNVAPASADALTFRPYRPGDETAILALFSASFGKEMSEAYWRWRYLDNPVAGPMIELAWDGGHLAAHYAVSPVMLAVDGVLMRAALSMTTMTDPGYRGRGLFPLMAERLYGRLREAGYGLVFGFPNVQSHRIFARDLGWLDLAPVPVMSVVLDALRGPPDLGGSVREEPGFGAWVEDIAVPPDGIGLMRSVDYLTWRFRAEPTHRYRLLVARDRARAAGYLVAKSFEDNLDIVDLYSEEAALPALIAHAASLATASGARRLTTWMPVYDPLFGGLERMGFQAGGPVTYMGGRVLPAAGSDLFDPRRWHVSMAMSDVF